jgi:hypothetical protein
LKPPSPDLPLDRVQRWMQAVIVQPGTVDEAVESRAARAELDPRHIEAVIRPSRTLTAVERVGVYQGMYLLRMIEALEGDYPAVAHFLGAEAFGKLVERYAEAHPSVSYTFNRFGAGFPEFIHESKGLRRRGVLFDLARLERAVTEAFDAPQSPAWPAEAIERLSEQAWETAVLKPAAALRILAFAYPVNIYLQSVKTGEHDHPALPRRASWVAVYRKNYEVWRLDLGEPAYRFLHALARGRPFGKAVAEAAKGLQGNAGEQIFRWLRAWVAEGMFESVATGADPA